jgi:lipopolysaccharide transport system ATP-binding protein
MTNPEWQIGITGTFDVENYGDLLFPLIAEAELRRRLGTVNLHRFSYWEKTPPEWPYAVTSVADLPHVIDQLDGLIIGGGFLIRFDERVADGYGPPSPEIHHPTGYWLTPALMALDRGIPVTWNAPGMHCNDIPEWAAPLLQLALRESAYVSVRDEPSQAALARFADGIEVMHDTGFGIARLVPREESPGMRRVRKLAGLTKPYIVVQPVRWRDDGFPEFLKANRKRFANYQLLGLPIGPVLGDSCDFFGEAKSDFARLPFWPDPLLLAEIISNAAGVIGYSYHLAITALTAGVPVFTSVDLSAGKFTALAKFDTLYPMSSIHEGADAFFARLGKTTPSASALATLPALDRHWDRIADAIRAGRRETRPAFGRFWQTLPSLLQRTSKESA